jgi:hypothetical protein
VEVPVHSFCNAVFELQECLPSSKTLSFVSVLAERQKCLSCSCLSDSATVASDQSTCCDAHLQRREIALLSSLSSDEAGEVGI